MNLLVMIGGGILLLLMIMMWFDLMRSVEGILVEFPGWGSRGGD